MPPSMYYFARSRVMRQFLPLALVLIFFASVIGFCIGVRMERGLQRTQVQEKGTVTR